MLVNTPSAETVGETAYRRIRADIIFGVLAPGQRLKLEKISEIYGTSISTLRELLNRMSSEGLIIAEGQRGFEVAPVSADEFQQVAVASAAARESCDRAILRQPAISIGKAALFRRTTSSP